MSIFFKTKANISAAWFVFAYAKKQVFYDTTRLLSVQNLKTFTVFLNIYFKGRKGEIGGKCSFWNTCILGSSGNNLLFLE